MKLDSKSVLRHTETLMLDMDGTLLDLAFDNFMWREHIPRQYAIKNDVPFGEAQTELADRFSRAEGDLNWYCLDHWSEHLELDVVQLHHDNSFRIGFLPGALAFLRAVSELPMRVLLVTNSHHETLALKDAVTGLSDFFDGIHSSHDYGHAKEDQAFWHALQDDVGFDPETTVFVDDSVPVLSSARRYGLQRLFAITRPDSRRPPRDKEPFDGIHGVADML